MSFLFGKTKETKETEREEYERLLLNKENKEKKEKEIDKIRKKLIEDKIAKMKKTLKQYPNISFEEAILRTYSQTSIFYNEKEIVELFNKQSQYSPIESQPIPSPPKPPPLPKKTTRSVPVSNLKIKSIPARQSLPKSSRMTGEIFNDVKYKLKKPKNKSPPKPPPLPKQRHSSKNNASKSRGSPLTSKKLEDTKNSLSVVKPKSPQKKELSPNDPEL